MAETNTGAYLKSKQRFVASGGVRFLIAEDGQGKGERPLVLISGWPQTIHVWRHMFGPLAERHHVIAVEPPALGQSEPLPAGQDSRTVGAAILALLDELGVGELDLIGHDIGTWLGFPMAHLAPERIKRMAVIDAALPGLAPPTAYALEPSRLMKVWHFYFNAVPDLPAALTEGRERIYIEQILRTRSEDFARTFTPDDVDVYVDAYARPGAMDAGFSYYRAIFKNIEDNQAFAARKLQLPILAIGGASWLGPVMEATFAGLGDKVTGASIAGSAHFVPEEQPEKLLAVIEPFLAQPTA